MDEKQMMHGNPRGNKYRIVKTGFNEFDVRDTAGLTLGTYRSRKEAAEAMKGM